MKPPLSAIATGRDASMFTPDIESSTAAMSERLTGARILAVGGAGSIGSSTVHVLSDFRLGALHIVDQNENALAELVRQLRSRSQPLAADDLRLAPLDYGSPAMKGFMEQCGPYDFVLNFAAIKHVRSEKDSFSLLQMFDTNVVKQARFMRWLGAHSPNADYFSVSTDKAANPVSFMGATKRIMEHVLFSPELADGIEGRITSARFANVAFSNGSLLQSFEQRLARGEPLAAPKDIRRYFVSLAESGQICALASMFAPTDSIAVPNLSPERHLVLVEDVARRFLEWHGLQAETFEDQDAAIAAAPALVARGSYPLIVTPADTAGEKPYEEFVGDGEQTTEFGLSALTAVQYAGLKAKADIRAFVDTVERWVAGDWRDGAPPDKEQMKALVAEIEPDFMSRHRQSTANLDQRA